MSNAAFKLDKLPKINIFRIFIFYFLFKISYIYSIEFNIIEFKSKSYRSGHFAFNSKGDMVIEFSSGNDRLLYGLKKNGQYLFEDSEGNELSTKEITIYNNGQNAKRYESQTSFVSLKNNTNKQYLFNIGSDRSIVELYDLEEDEFIFKPSTTEFLGNTIYSYTFSLIELENDEEEKEYLLVYMYDKKYKLQKFSFSSFSLDLDIVSSSPVESNFDNRIVSSFIYNGLSSPLIILFYIDKTSSIYQYEINIYNLNLNYLGNSEIDTINSFNEGEGIFSKGFHLKNYFVIFIYFKGRETGSLTLKIGTISNTYSFEAKLTKYINEYYFRTDDRINEFIKVNDERFIYIAFKETTLTDMTILLIDLFNNYNNIKIREYKVILRGLEAKFDLTANIYNDLLVFSSTVRNDGIDNMFAIFMMFGYVNGTDEIIDISEYFLDDNNENDIITKLTQNIEIQNNIFGYEVLTDQIKLISIPDELLFYNRNGDEESLVNNEGILKRNYIIKQNEEKVKNNNYYYLEYQIIVQEPDYVTFNYFSINIIDASTSFYSGEDQRSYFVQKQFYGRTNTLKFKLCHKFCMSCNKFGTSNDSQQCLTCLEEYQYGYPNESSSNCVPEGFFYNENLNRLIQCNDSNSKFYINLTNNKRICFDINLDCPDELPYFNETNNECQNFSSPETTIITEANELPETTIISEIPETSVIYETYKTSETSEGCSYDELLENECLLENKNKEEIYDIIKNEIIQNYPENGESVVIETEDNYVFQITTGSNEINSINGNYNNEYNLSMIDLGDCESLLKQRYFLDESVNLIIFKYEKVTNVASEKNIQYEVYEPFNKTKLNLSVCQTTPVDIFIPVVLSDETQDLYEDLKNNGYDLFNINDKFYQDICTQYKSKDGTDVLLSDRKNDYYNNNDTTCQSNCQYSSYSIETKYLKCECNVISEDINTEHIDKFNSKKIFTSFYDVLKYSNYKILKCFKLVFNIDLMLINIGSIISFIYFLIYLCFLGIFIVKGIYPLKVYTSKLVFISNNKQNIKYDIKNNKKEPIKYIKKNKVRNKKKINARKSTEKNSNSNPPTKKKLKKKIKRKIIKKTNINIVYNNFGIPSLNFKKNYNDKDKNNILVNTNFKLNESQRTHNPFMDNKSKEEKTKLDNFELNELEYYEAIELDKRKFYQIYWAILMREHIILFTFFSRNDYNIVYIKFARFIFLVCTDMALNVFFFSDDSMHKIYLNYGKYNFIQQIPQIIYSTAVSQLLEVFLCYLSLTDKHIYQIKNLNLKGNSSAIFKVLRCIKLKLIGFYVFTFILFVFFWYFISAFCSVYHNTQIIFIKDSVSSFLTGLIYPFILYLFPSVLRILSLKDNEKKRLKWMYKLSDIIPFF